jgi:CRP-like cAMP-binding protein
MSLEDDIAFFEQVPTFAVLGTQALRILAIGAETKQLPSGAVLFYAGALVGELALLTDTVCATTAIAKGPTVVIRISRSLFRKMLEGYPDAAQKLRDMVAERVEGWTHELGGVKQVLDK